MKKNHTIIVGTTSLTQSVYTLLHKSGHELLVIAPTEADANYAETADLIVGDATDVSVLKHANAAQAKFILALRDNDAENAFIVLAAKEAGSEETRTVALMNHSIHINKIKQAKPDVILSLQSLGAEVLSRLVTKELITEDTLTRLLFPLDIESRPPKAG